MEMDLSFAPILFSFIFSILFSIYYLPSLFRSRKDGNQSSKLPPGTFGLPFIGETRHFVNYGKKGIAERFALDRMDKHSSTVIKTSLFGERMAVLCGPEANKFIFSNENKQVKAWRPRSIDTLFGDLDANALKRRILYKAHQLSPEALQKYVPLMDSATKEHLENYWEGRDVVTAHKLMENFTFTLTCRLFLRMENNETIESLFKPFHELMKGLHSLPLNFPGTTFYRALKGREKIREGIKAWINKWKSDFSEGRLSSSQLSLADILNRSFEEDDIADIIMSLISGAFESTSTVLSSIIMNMAQFPHVYDKVLAEQREIAKSKRGENLNWEDVNKMKYSWNVVCESLRLHVGDVSFKEAISDITYGGFSIPKGWKLYSSQAATHRNPKYFKDPRKFDPSRFEGDGLIPYSFTPFSGGPRMCPGKEYAKTKILIFMHNLVIKFRWEQIFPDEEMMTIPAPMPSKGLPIRLYPHKP